LSINKGERTTGTEIIDQNVTEGFFQIAGRDLASLYKFAWFGQPYWVAWDTLHYYNYWREPVLALRDSSLFQYNYDAYTGLYNYSLIVPREKSTKEYLMKTMQRDLENNVGFTAIVETRMMPYWKLTATPQAKKKLLSTHTKPERVENGPEIINVKAIPIEELVAHIIHYSSGPMPIINETGITERIDINLEAAFIDIEDVRSALRKYGLLLEKSMKPMKVLVVKEMDDRSALH
jgi:hypothetical protein